jgi:protein-disulfide isomerase
MRAPTLALLVAGLLAVPATAQIPVAPAPQRVQVDAAGDPSLGRPGAPVTIVEFCDFHCSACAELSGSMRRLARDYADQVRIVFRDFPLDSHPEADRAAEAASCAQEQGRFWEMHDVLFANSDLSDNAMRRYAQTIGADVNGFMTCLNSGRYESEWRKDRADGHSYGVNVTPTLFVNGLVVEGVPSYSDLVQLVRQELPAR